MVSVKAIREILKEISSERERWWVEEEDSASVTLGYNKLPEADLGLNNILFRFPKVANIPLFPDGDGEIICLYPISRDAVQRGLYWENDRLLADEFRDWETFWPPIQKIVARRYSEGSGVRSMSPKDDSSSSSPNRSAT